MIALRRLTFGPRPQDTDHFRELGKTDRARLEAFVESQLHPEGITDLRVEARIAEARLPTLEKSLRQLWADHNLAANALRDNAAKATPSPLPSPPIAAGNFKGGDPIPTKSADATKRAGSTTPGAPLVPMVNDEGHLRQQPARETEAATWIRAVYSNRQLQEVMAGFWHDHFNVFAWDGQIAPVFVHYDRDVIRKHVLGNFRELLEAVARSPAMLFYLDNAVSQSGNPNENYARELFELHTLGAENYLGTEAREKVPGFAKGEPIGYVDGDVYESARCFTGWRVQAGKGTEDNGEFFYFEQWHDRFQKIVLGQRFPEYQSPMKDGEQVLDRVASHPGTARHLARKLCTKLIGDEPPRRIIEEAAAVFQREQKRPDQIRRVVRTIILSPEFRESYRQKLRRPFESSVAMLRALDADFSPTEAFLNNYQRSGQRLFYWRSPDGYPENHLRWSGTNPMLERWRLANQISSSGLAGVRSRLLETMPEQLTRPGEIARYWRSRLLGDYPGQEPNASALEAEMAGLLAQGRSPETPLPPEQLKPCLPAMVALALMSPEFQWK